jgi:hypothetical protein
MNSLKEGCQTKHAMNVVSHVVRTTKFFRSQVPVEEQRTSSALQCQGFESLP